VLEEGIDHKAIDKAGGHEADNKSDCGILFRLVSEKAYGAYDKG